MHTAAMCHLSVSPIPLHYIIRWFQGGVGLYERTKRETVRSNLINLKTVIKKPNVTTSLVQSRLSFTV